MNTFNVTFKLSPNKRPDAESAELLNLAANAFESEYSLPVTVTRSDPEPNQRGDLTTAIALVSLALTSIKVIIDVLNYLKSRKPKLRYRIRAGNQEIEYDDEYNTQLEKRLIAWATTSAPEERELTIEIEQ